MKDLQQKSIKAFLWDFGGRFANQLVAFVISIFLARLLMPEDFGLLAMVNVIIAFSYIFLDMGLSVALIQKAEIKPEHYGSVFWFNLVSGIFLAAILFGLSNSIAHFYNNQAITPIARVMAVIFIINAFGRVISVKLQKELKFDVPVKAQLIAAIIGGGVGITMAFLDYGVWSLVAQSLIHATVSNALLYIMEKWRPRLYFSWQALRELWGFGMRMFLSGVLETVFKNLDALIIGKLFLPATLGYYHRAKSLNNIVVDNASGSLMRIFLPTLSSVQNDKQRVLNIVDKSYHLITMIAFFITGFLFVTGRDIIILMFSDKWEPSVPLFRLIVLSAYAYPISAILVNILVALGNSKAFLRLEIIKKIVLLANFIIGFHFGIHEFLIGFVIANAISVLLNIYFASKQIEVSMRWFIFRSMPYVLITLFSAASAYFIFIKWDDVFVLHGLASGIFYIAMFIAGLFLTQTKGLKLIIEEIHNHNIKKWFKK